MIIVPCPCFALLTDFGYDFAVGSIKGVILNKLPGANIIDLDHSIKKFSIISGAFVLGKSYDYFPKGTVFICVIDPGVGTERQPICIKTPNYSFVGPNNGLFDYILEQEPIRDIYQIDESYLTKDANTFHGRDLFAPAAVDFYQENLQKFKLFPEQQLVHLPFHSNQMVVTYIDSFGNIKTNKSCNQLARLPLTIDISGRRHIIPFVKTFKDVKEGDLLCYQGSNGTLEIAVNQGSAARKLGIYIGDAITIL